MFMISTWTQQLALLVLAAAALFVPHLALGQAVEITRARPDTKVNRLLNESEQAFAQGRYEEPWATYLKQITDIGPEAVPDLIAELDTTESEIMLRNLGFILRAIGDKRAVPALIRAFPKTLRKSSSDMGLRVGDKNLL